MCRNPVIDADENADTPIVPRETAKKAKTEGNAAEQIHGSIHQKLWRTRTNDLNSTVPEITCMHSRPYWERR